MTRKDTLGDRIKNYESQSDIRMLHFIPVIARLDGKGFSKFTKGLKRPYDERLKKLKSFHLNTRQRLILIFKLKDGLLIELIYRPFQRLRIGSVLSYMVKM